MRPGLGVEAVTFNTTFLRFLAETFIEAGNYAERISIREGQFLRFLAETFIEALLVPRAARSAIENFFAF